MKRTRGTFIQFTLTRVVIYKQLSLVPNEHCYKDIVSILKLLTIPERNYSLVNIINKYNHVSVFGEKHNVVLLKSQMLEYKQPDWLSTGLDMYVGCTRKVCKNYYALYPEGVRRRPGRPRKRWREDLDDLSDGIVPCGSVMGIPLPSIAFWDEVG